VARYKSSLAGANTTNAAAAAVHNWRSALLLPVLQKPVVTSLHQLLPLALLQALQEPEAVGCFRCCL
jgi:hypothetical protein